MLRSLAQSVLAHPRYRAIEPYLMLLLWTLPLLLWRSSQQSLMAHDEGIYAAQAKTILETGNWVAPQWGQGFSFDRTIGIQWLIAGSMGLFGQSEDTVRLPSTIAFLISVGLVYRIGVHLLTPRLAKLAAAIFAVMPISLQYARLGTQDSVLVCVELLGIWALLEGEYQQQQKKPEERSRLSFSAFSVLTGAAFGWGFLIKGFMIIPATIALFPYLIASHRRYRHLLNPWLYFGFMLGLLPVASWVWAAIAQYGWGSMQELFGKLFHLKEQTYQGAGPFYYFWNVPANGFPWVLFGLVGLGLSVWNSAYRHLLEQRWLLLVGFPVTLFIELTLFGTKTHYYPLQLLPWFALLAAIALQHGTDRYMTDRRPRILSALSWGFAGLAGVLLLAGIAVLSHWVTIDVANLDKITLVVMVLGIGWLMPLGVWLWRSRTDASTLAKSWLVSVLMGPWLALSILGLTGLWGNYNPDLKTFLETPQVASVLASQPVNFVVDEANLSREDRKRYLLLSFYTPHVGAYLPQFPGVTIEGMAWLDPQQPVPPISQVVAQHHGWKLVQIP